MSTRDRDVGRKFESGSLKRKRAIKRKQVEENLRGSLYKFMKSDKESETLLHSNPAEILPSTSSCVPASSISENNDSNLLPITLPPPLSSTLFSQNSVSEIKNPQNDPGLWPSKMIDLDRTEIVSKGPIRAKVDFYPVNESGRRFSEYHYSKVLAQNI